MDHFILRRIVCAATEAQIRGTPTFARAVVSLAKSWQFNVRELPSSMRLTDTGRSMDLQISMKAASEDGHTALYLTLKAELVKADAELQAARSGERHP